MNIFTFIEEVLRYKEPIFMLFYHKLITTNYWELSLGFYRYMAKLFIFIYMGSIAPQSLGNPLW